MGEGSGGDSVKYQFVIWSIFDSDSWRPLIYFKRFNYASCYSKIYKWVIGIGPVEVRRWK